MRKTHEQNYKFNKEIETIKKNQTEILELEEYNDETEKFDRKIQ